MKGAVMNAQQQITNREAFEELSKWAVGLGIIGVALFPLSIPILVLTAVALAPLALVLAPFALPAVPFALVRRALRARRRGSSSPPSEPAPAGPIRPAPGAVVPPRAS